MWRVKSLDAILATAEKKSLHRSLGPIQLTLLGIGAIIGTGIFVLTAAASQKAGPGMMVSFVIAGAVCAFAVELKWKLGYDDSLDAFGVHGIGGMIGAIGTGIVYAPSLGGPGAADYAMGAKLLVQIEAVATTIVWASIGTVIAITIAKLLTGLRVSPEVEQEGLDLGEHGERAYN